MPYLDERKNLEIILLRKLCMPREIIENKEKLPYIK